MSQTNEPNISNGISSAGDVLKKFLTTNWTKTLFMRNEKSCTWQLHNSCNQYQKTPNFLFSFKKYPGFVHVWSFVFILFSFRSM